VDHNAMKLKAEHFRVAENATVALKKWPTKVAPFYSSNDDYEKLLKVQIAELSDLQEMLYASNRHGLLLIFQAMDAAGKDGIIKHVLSGINPQGCQVASFKHPSARELDHDFLWRAVLELPERGNIGVFNRSYYEEVLIVRVHPELLVAESVPNGAHKKPGKQIWKERYRSIRDLEKHLHSNGTRIIKFFLHLSKEEQRQRFLARIDDPHKNWKFNNGDLEERKFWPKYMHAYEQCLSATSTEDSPWYVVPADDKPNARLIVARIIHETLKALDLKFPDTTPARRRELLSLRKRLSQKNT
jgi:PPK2 family polyphosphate:nucleotide phosphotransferase